MGYYSVFNINNKINMKIKIVSFAMLALMSTLPLITQADIVSLQPLSAASASTPASLSASPLNCFDFRSTLGTNSKGYEVRGLQFALIQEGFSITPSEFGTFGSDTLTAVNAFQQKYASDILTNGLAPTGRVGRMTRNKLNALYGCTGGTAINVGMAAPKGTLPTSVVLSVKDVSIDSSGVTAVFCNGSPTDVPVFPARVRLNGIIRDFNVVGALKAGSCDTDTVPFGVWGLTYDPGSTYGVVTALDPNGMYKTAQVSYPLTATTTLSIPAVAGAHLSVRGITIKSNGIQGTLCNLGSADLSNYPVRVTVNGTSKDMDVPSLHTHGQCQTITWTYDMFGIYPQAGATINSTVNIDPNNAIQETNEFDNSATVVGTI